MFQNLGLLSIVQNSLFSSICVIGSNKPVYKLIGDSRFCVIKLFKFRMLAARYHWYTPCY